MKIYQNGNARRAARKPRPNDNAPEIVWAVYLGANNAARLATEWGISSTKAAQLLRSAASAGHLRVACFVRRRHWTHRLKVYALPVERDQCFTTGRFLAR